MLLSVTILVAIAAVFTLGVNVHFMWCGFWTMVSDALSVFEINSSELTISNEKIQ